jgi:hypothetical protein
MTRQRMEFHQQFQRLAGQRYRVGPTQLHPTTLEAPFPAHEIELVRLCFPEFHVSSIARRSPPIRSGATIAACGSD